jgi:predicted acyl esterase
VAHPSYDSVWQGRAVQRYLRHTTVPTLTVGGWWDQEDGFGYLASYKVLEESDSANLNSLVAGPWFHGQWYDDGGDSLATIRFGRRTGDDYRALQARWFARWLKDRQVGRFAEATLFDAGTNTWREFDQWPARGAVRRKLYLQPGGDQRFVDNRPDVRSWQTGPLDADITIAGDVIATLFASTTGTDADWVVKLIDVHPDSGVDRAAMRGYQLMVASDVLRGRYREGFDRPKAIRPNAVLPYTVDLHQQAYTFRKGHRIMVQVQSTWFPLYDRNPQTFVPNIFKARASDYRARTHAVHHAARHPSHVEVQVLEQP